MSLVTPTGDWFSPPKQWPAVLPHHCIVSAKLAWNLSWGSKKNQKTISSDQLHGTNYSGTPPKKWKNTFSLPFIFHGLMRKWHRSSNCWAKTPIRIEVLSRYDFLSRQQQQQQVEVVVVCENSCCGIQPCCDKKVYHHYFIDHYRLCQEMRPWARTLQSL